MSPASYRAAPPRVGEISVYLSGDERPNPSQWARPSGMFDAMTTPSDPFVNAPTTPVPASATPQAPPPPGYSAPTSAIYGAAPAPKAPTALRTWTIILTLLVTLLVAGSSAFIIVDFDSYIKTLDQQSTTPVIDGNTILQVLATPLWIGAYVVLALWMSKIRSNLKAIGRDPGGISSVEWWGWFVPIANYVLPALGMRSITKKSVNGFVVLLWWLAFCAYWIAGFANGVVIFGAIDWNTGVYDNDALLALKPVTVVSAASLAIAWIFLTIIVSRTTRRHLEVK